MFGDRDRRRSLRSCLRVGAAIRSSYRARCAIPVVDWRRHRAQQTLRFPHPRRHRNDCPLPHTVRAGEWSRAASCHAVDARCFIRTRNDPKPRRATPVRDFAKDTCAVITCRRRAVVGPRSDRAPDQRWCGPVDRPSRTDRCRRPFRHAVARSIDSLSLG